MQTISEKTVREIAIENPASMRVFESLGIDYCCGGKTPLSEACSRARIELDRVLELLTAADRVFPGPEEADWRGKPLGGLIAYIVGKHHALVRQETPRIASLLLKVAAKHGPAHPEIMQIEVLFTAIGQELSSHMRKEEQVLFPYIERMEEAASNGIPAPAACFASVQMPIANMVSEHDDAGGLLRNIRGLLNGYTAPSEACPTFLALYRGLEEFERDLHQHIHLENNILFPGAIELEQVQ